jgi:hypothetical protein
MQQGSGLEQQVQLAQASRRMNIVCARQTAQLRQHILHRMRRRLLLIDNLGAVFQAEFDGIAVGEYLLGDSPAIDPDTLAMAPIFKQVAVFRFDYGGAPARNARIFEQQVVSDFAAAADEKRGMRDCYKLERVFGPRNFQHRFESMSILHNCQSPIDLNAAGKKSLQKERSDSQENRTFATPLAEKSPIGAVFTGSTARP